VKETLPRAGLFHNLRFCPDENAALQAVADLKTNITTTAIVERAELGSMADAAASYTASKSSDNPEVPVQEAHIIKYTPMCVDVAVDAAEPGLLMLNDTFYPGWNAYLDGGRQPIGVIHADYLFRGVFVPDGKHNVEFRYEPMWFFIGVLTAAFALILLGSWGIASDPPLSKKAGFTRKTLVL
jgi:uncharacterized membrane protein YfhO